jgi:hypothetical protein
MAQGFMKDEELCKQYAQFASELDRWHFKIIYWFMFVLNLVILFIASWTYTKYIIPLLRAALKYMHITTCVLTQSSKQGPRNDRAIQP